MTNQPIINRLNKDSTIITLFNGSFKAQEEISALLPNRKEGGPLILTGWTTHGIIRTGEFSITHTGEGITCVGSIDQLENSADIKQAENVYNILSRHWKPINFNVLSSKEIRETTLLKIIINSCINPMASLSDCKNGQLLSPKSLLFIRKLCKEANDACPELLLNSDEIFHRVTDVAKKTFNNRNSMLVDLDVGHTEIDYINGYLISKGKNLGLQMNHHQTVLDLVNIKAEIKRIALGI